MPETAVWAHNDQHGRSNAIARGDFRADAVWHRELIQYGLSLIPDDEPPRHASIKGWPTATPENRELRNTVSKELRRIANPVLVRRPADTLSGTPTDGPQ